MGKGYRTMIRKINGKAVFLISIMLLFMSATKVSAAEFSMYLLGESFTWQQAGDIGGREKNQGFLYGIGAMGKWNPYSNLTLKVTTETKGNRFDDEKVEFLMIKVSGDIGWKFLVNDSLLIEPFIGFGYRRWLRDLEPLRGLFPYTQIWRSHYGRIGVEANHTFSDAIESYMNAGVIFPVATRMKMNAHNIRGRVNFNSIPSGFGEIGIKYKMLVASVYYEGIRFPASRDTINGFRQPESKADMFGIKLGVEF